MTYFKETARYVSENLRSFSEYLLRGPVIILDTSRQCKCVLRRWEIHFLLVFQLKIQLVLRHNFNYVSVTQKLNLDTTAAFTVFAGNFDLYVSHCFNLIIKQIYSLKLQMKTHR
jgi:hypothetical protein